MLIFYRLHHQTPIKSQPNQDNPTTMQTSTETKMLQDKQQQLIAAKPTSTENATKGATANATLLQENLLQRSIHNVALTLQNAMISSLQQAALLPANSAAAAALNLQALESYLTLQRLTTVSATAVSIILNYFD